MSAKKLLNDPADCVAEAVEGLLLSHPDLKRVEGTNVIVRGDIESFKNDHVTIISGGGSGHEPAHAGYIGSGMLSAAVLGNVYASPSISAILAAIRTCASPKGVLLIVKNYTGDRLNFGIALEKAKAEGIDGTIVVVDDDCALPKGKGITGGRGVAGTVLVHKLAGAAAQAGASLAEVAAAATEGVEAMGTMGVALTPCIVPGNAPSDRLAGDKIEIGMGIHGEPGRESRSLPADKAADKLADIMLESILGSGPGSPDARLETSPDDSVVLLVNNLGATPLLELLVVARRLISRLREKYQLRPVRVYVGPFMTALEMAGVSATILRLDTQGRMEAALDNPTLAPAWTAASQIDPNYDPSLQIISYSTTAHNAKARGGPACPLAPTVIRAVCERVASIESELTKYDSICGDGDCGLVMKAGVTRVLADMSIHEAHVDDAAALCSSLADSVSSSMGGTSGVLLELALRAMVARFTAVNGADVSWADAVAAGVDAIGALGGAQPGMRTMLDALVPAADELRAGGSAASAAIAAQRGAEATKTMASLAGRSNYVDAALMEGVPDPGAWAMAAMLDAAAKAL